MSKGPLRFSEGDATSKEFFKISGGNEDSWLFNVTGRVEEHPTLKINLLSTIRYNFQKINKVEEDLWGIKIVLDRRNWEELYSCSGRYRLIFEVMMYNKYTGRRESVEFFRMPQFLKDKSIYKISKKDIINDAFYDINVKVVVGPEDVNLYIRFR
tara:strand:+ start:30 stop:494 length:465 start_codon:yes stop_codon:yes gene_type:complete